MKKIYLIHKTNSNTYKIGKSKHPSKRVNQLQTANGNKLELLYEYSTKVPDQLEKMLHINFKTSKQIGEWFELNENQVSKFSDTCIELEKVLLELKDENYFFDKL